MLELLFTVVQLNEWLSHVQYHKHKTSADSGMVKVHGSVPIIVSGACRQGSHNKMKGRDLQHQDDAKLYLRGEQFRRTDKA